MVTSKLHVVLYYGGDKVGNEASGMRSITGRLTRHSKYFDGAPKRAWTVIITSYNSLSARHGPTELKVWRMAEKKMSEETAKAIMSRFDPEWPHAIEGLFNRVVLDEAHLVRNEDAFISITIRWLKANFHVCLTATPLFNSYMDFKGLSSLLIKKDSDKLWNYDRLQSLEAFPSTNPFLVPTSHISSVLRLTHRAMRHFVWDSEVSKETAGARIGQIWEMCLVRRTLMSRMPFHTGPKIGEDIPPTQSRVVTARFTPPEQDYYNMVTAVLYHRLVTMLPNGQLIWNMGKYRKLALLTTWLGFAYVHGSVQAVNMNTVLRLIDENRLVMRWLNNIAGQKEEREPFPEGTDPNDPMVRQRQLTLVLRESPRLRALLPRILDQVVLQKEKAIVWTLFPAQQAFVGAMLRLVGIDARIFSANLSSLERSELVQLFNESRTEAMVLVCSYSVNSAGLNLQHLCRNVHLFETALSEAIMMQAIGRVRRIGQRRIVKVYDYRVPDSFNARQVEKALEKSVPGLIAEMNSLIFQYSHTEDDNLQMNNWAMKPDGKVVRIQEGVRELPEGWSWVDAHSVISHLVRTMKGEIN